MGCPCKDPVTGVVVEVPAKTKEMVYRAQAPWIQESIEKEKNTSTGISKAGSGSSGKGQQ